MYLKHKTTGSIQKLNGVHRVDPDQELGSTIEDDLIEIDVTEYETKLTAWKVVSLVHEK